MKRIGVILSGCGYLDGAEIRESVLTLLALDMAGAEAVMMAPDIEQHHVVNHLNSEETDEKRNVLIESARIARGKVVNIADVNYNSLDGLIIPGGFGVAKNLSDFAFVGHEAHVNLDIQQCVRQIHADKKPIGAICIAPAMIAKAFHDENISVTIGNDSATAAEIEKTGNRHVNCGVSETCIDEENKIITTPAYMYDDGAISDIFKGIQDTVNKVLSWT